MAVSASPKGGILSLNISDKQGLYAAYMPYLTNGGLFISTNKNYQIGDEVFMLVSLMDEAEKMPIAGKVVWVTPTGAESGQMPGIGIELSENHANVVQKIETYLAGAIDSDRPTNTM